MLLIHELIKACFLSLHWTSLKVRIHETLVSALHIVTWLRLDASVKKKKLDFLCFSVKPSASVLCQNVLSRYNLKWNFIM